MFQNILKPARAPVLLGLYFEDYIYFFKSWIISSLCGATSWFVSTVHALCIS